MPPHNFINDDPGMKAMKYDLGLRMRLEEKAATLRHALARASDDEKEAIKANLDATLQQLAEVSSRLP